MEKPYYTVQVYSKPVKIDAINESNKLFDFGFEDVYIEPGRTEISLNKNKIDYSLKIRLHRHLDKLELKN